MKIILLSSSYPSDENPLFGPLAPVYARELNRQGCKVHLVIPLSSGTPLSVPGAAIHQYGHSPLEKSFARHSLLHPGDFVRSLRFILDGEQALVRLCREEQPDACLSFWALPSGWLCLKAKRTVGVPYAVFCLGSDIHTWARYPLIGCLIRIVLKNADRIYADGFELGREAERISGKHCAYLPSTTADMRVPHSKPLRPPRPYKFLFAGRLEKVKGADLVIPAFAKCLRLIRTPADLTIAGDGSLRDLLKKQAESLAPGSTVRLTGR